MIVNIFQFNINYVFIFVTGKNTFYMNIFQFLD